VLIRIGIKHKVAECPDEGWIGGIGVVNTTTPHLALLEGREINLCHDAEVVGTPFQGAEKVWI
jgi:hypothetical protein